MQNFTDGNELVAAPLACERPPARSLFVVLAMAKVTLPLSKRCQGTGAGDTLFPENSLPGSLVAFRLQKRCPSQARRAWMTWRRVSRRARALVSEHAPEAPFATGSDPVEFQNVAVRVVYSELCPAERLHGRGTFGFEAG